MLKTKILYVLLMFCLFLVNPIHSQQIESEKTKIDTLSIWKRISFHTSVVDWATLVPNIGVEWEISGVPENRYSILFNGKYNWNTKHSLNPRFIYNVSNVSLEGRRYWRTSGKARKLEKRDTTLRLVPSLFMKMRKNVFSGRTCENPRDWRAYYLGLYAGLDKYSLAFGQEGKQGKSYNVGVTAGWSIPLYPLKNGSSIDLDLGCALVIKLTQYDKFRYHEESACYAYSASKPLHVVPFPVVQDIHVSLVYRFRSIQTKVKGGDMRYEEWEKLQAEKQKIRRDRLDSLSLKRDSVQKVYSERKKEKEQLQELKQIQKDSIRQAKLVSDSLAVIEKEQLQELKQIQKDSIRQAKLVSDSLAAIEKEQLQELKQIQKDSIRQAKLVSDSLADVEKEKLKELKKNKKDTVEQVSHYDEFKKIPRLVSPSNYPRCLRQQPIRLCAIIKKEGECV